jgi:hypothetical protein
VADASCCAQDGWTALLQASWNGHDECVRMLRLAGATVQSASEQTAGTAPYLEARYSTPLPRLGQRPLNRHPATHTHTPLPPARPRLPKGVTSPHVNSTGAEVCYSTMIHDSHDDRFALCVDVCRRMVFTERKAQAAGQGDRLKGAPGLSEIPMRSLYS